MSEDANEMEPGSEIALAESDEKEFLTEKLSPLMERMTLSVSYRRISLAQLLRQWIYVFLKNTN